jgi:hypothetical protein
MHSCNLGNLKRTKKHKKEKGYLIIYYYYIITLSQNFPQKIRFKVSALQNEGWKLAATICNNKKHTANT